MDRGDWLFRVQEDGWQTWQLFVGVADKVDCGRRTAWCLNLLDDLCSRLDCRGKPDQLPRDARVIRQALEGCLEKASPQIRSLGIGAVRRMLLVDPKCVEIIQFLPRYRRTESVSLLQRQARLVEEDAIPKNTVPWVGALLREILYHEASGNWRTSKTANQTLHLIHRFLRSCGLLDCNSLEEFHSYVQSLTEEDVIRVCHDFTDRFCTTDASARRYLVIFNLVFFRVWGVVPQKLHVPTKKRRIYTIQEMDDRLSQSTKRSSQSGGSVVRQPVDYFNADELKQIREAANQRDQRLRDNLIVSLLETTGLRRKGVLNILVNKIATQGDETGQWVALPFGNTLTKGAKWHRFQVHGVLQKHVETWLNTAESDGGRPCGPSPYLLPSALCDNAPLSTTTLSNIFKSICGRAGLGGDPRAHLHAMRHSCAHTLSAQGNTLKQVSLVLGHRSTQVTEMVYLRDNIENGCASMVVPDHWKPETSIGAAINKPEDANRERKPKEKKVSTRELLARTMEMVEKNMT